MEQERKPKSLRFILGIALFIVSTIIFALMLLVPTLDVSFEEKTKIAIVLAIIGEILFWISAYLLGKELFQKYKSYLNPTNWLKNNKDESESNSVQKLKQDGAIIMVAELVTEEPLLSQVREIFREYQSSLGIDLCFQNFEEELASLPGEYAPPQGRLYLAYVDGQLAGCIALRPFEENQCEMKRLYIRPQYRGHNLGKQLAEKIIDDARQIGYRQMFLDTLPTMTVAQALYRSLNFCEMQAYRYNPVEGALYMGLNLYGRSCESR